MYMRNAWICQERADGAAGSMVYGLHGSDPIVLASATVVVVLIAWIATAIPAHHASRTDLVLVLRGG